MLCFQATLFGQLAHVISNSNSTRALYLHRMDAANDTMHSLGLPASLQQRVRHLYDYKWKRYRFLNREEFFSTISKPLQAEISLHLSADLIQAIEIFKRCKPDAMIALVTKLVKIAAEIEGSEEICRFYIHHGIAVSLGHQMAGYSDLQRLSAAGAAAWAIACQLRFIDITMQSLMGLLLMI